MLDAKFALVTGASSGIGECFARALAERRRNLVLVARSKSKLEALAEELRAKHAVRAEPIDFDLSLSGVAARLVLALRQRGIDVDLLINNAGSGGRGEFWKIALERQAEMVRLNIQAVVDLTYLLLPPMIEARSGAIINVASMASFQPVPYTTVYAATKSFVTSFSLGLAEELGPWGIKVVTLCPGGTRTNFLQAGQYGTREFPGGLQAPEEVVDAALRALARGGGLVIPRLFNKFGVFAQRFIPRSWPVKVAARVFRP